MNLYIVTEGIGEKRVYKRWIPLVNPLLKPVEDIRDVVSNNFLIVRSSGQPDFFDVCIKGIIDVNDRNNFDRLVLVADSENSTLEEKRTEIENRINPFLPCKAQIFIIVQHFCLETWALGNTQIHRRNPWDRILLSYRKIYDVKAQDPEGLPVLSKQINRAQFALRYLKTTIHDKYPNKSYHKRNPAVLYDPGYFLQVRMRFEKIHHIQSFAKFLQAFL